MAKQPKAKTGEFHCQAWLGPEALEAEKRATSVRLVDEMARCVASVVQDGRAYELVVRFPAWAPDPEGGWGPGYERRRVDFSLVLLDAVQAEVGEWVKKMPVAVPEEDYFHKLAVGSGCLLTEFVFQRGLWGWVRVE